MQLRLINLSGLAGLRDDLAAGNLVAALHRNLIVVGVGGDPTVVMAQQDQIAVAAQFRSGIGNDAILGCVDLGSQGNGEIDPIIVSSVLARAEVLDDAAPDRPAQLAARAGSIGFLDGRRNRDRTDTPRLGNLARCGYRSEELPRAEGLGLADSCSEAFPQPQRMSLRLIPAPSAQFRASRAVGLKCRCISEARHW